MTRSKNNLLAGLFRQAAALWFPLLVAVFSFGLLQIEGVERSFLGAPDREMLQAAFKLRDGVARGSGDPVLWLDLDYDTITAHTNSQRLTPTMSKKNGLAPNVPRQLLAETLAYARQPGATLVVLDVDIGWRAPDPLGEDKLEAELTAWSADPNAPLLLLVRDVLALPNGATLISTRFDNIVAAAPNIAFAGVTMLSGSGGIREFVANQCYVTDTGIAGVLPSVVTFADLAQAAYRSQDASPLKTMAATIKSRVLKTPETAKAQCRSEAREAKRDGVISWHIGYSYPYEIKAAQVSSRWPQQVACDVAAPPLTATRISFADIMSDISRASVAPLCGHMVIIGGDNAITKDRTATPLGILPGPVVLANAMRGHFDTGPIVRENWSLLRMALQAAVLILTVLAIVSVFDLVAGLRVRIRSAPMPQLGERILLLITHPLVFKFVVAFVTFLVGVVVTALSLELGFWGLLSAPAYFATLFEAWKQIDSERERAV